MLTAVQVKSARAATKRIKMSDGRGLMLIVSPCGGKWWRYRYKIDGKERLLSLGTYPAMSLAQARVARDEASTMRAKGIDPLAEKQEADAHARGESLGDTVEKLANDWFQAASTNWTEKNTQRIWSRIQNNVLPIIGKRDPRSIEPIDILSVLKPIESRGAIETAHRVRGYLSRIFRFGIASQRSERDPAADVRDALATKPEKIHFAAITDPNSLAVMLRDIEDYRGRWYAVLPALKLTPYLLVRPGMLRQMRWQDVNFSTAEWVTESAKGHRLKTVVPLATQVLEILQDLEVLSGQGEYVFPNPRAPRGDRPLSENAVRLALRSMGYGENEVTAHGFRATARTMLDEVLRWRVDWIETRLGHSVRDANGRAYNRTSYLPERQIMMQAWADYLDALRVEGKAVDPMPYRQSSLVE